MLNEVFKWIADNPALFVMGTCIVLDIMLFIMAYLRAEEPEW